MPNIETEKEEDGRRIAEIEAIPGVIAYGETREQAINRVEALALRVLADRLENGENIPDLNTLFAAWADGLAQKPNKFWPHYFELVGKLNGNQDRISYLSWQVAGWTDFVFAFHHRDKIGPKMLARIAKHTGLKPEDLWRSQFLVGGLSILEA